MKKPGRTASYITVQIEGPHLEQFMNGCFEHGIHIWSVERPTANMLIVRMHPRDFSGLRHIQKRKQWDIRIIDRYGPVFAFRRLARRQLFAITALIVVGVWYALSAHIWFIHVTGTDDVKPETVLAVAKEAGLVQGARKKEIDRDELQRWLLIHLDELVWAGIEIRGTKATIHIAERTVADDDMYGPGHIVSSHDAVIERVSVARGQSVVTVGDTVRQGQIVISGMLEPGTEQFLEKTSDGQPPYIRADGTVDGIVWHRVTAEVRVDGRNIREATEEAALLAQELLHTALDEAEATIDGTPQIMTEFHENTGIVEVQAAVQAKQNVARFEPVLP